MSGIYTEKDKTLFKAMHSIGQMIYRARIQDVSWGANATPLEIYNLWISKEGFPIDPSYLTLFLEHIDFLRTGSLSMIGIALFADGLISEAEKDLGVAIAIENKN